MLGERGGADTLCWADWGPEVGIALQSGSQSPNQVTTLGTGSAGRALTGWGSINKKDRGALVGGE